MINLSNHGWMGLGIYIGFKSSFRKDQMEYIGVDYDKFAKEVTKIGLMKSGRIDIKTARKHWEDRFGNILPSQCHQYREELGFPYK